VRVVAYDPNMQGRWDEFITSSKNGTFLFRRGYMDYHADRFPDASLVVLDSDDRWVAVLPATRRGNELTSHAGLTYGGFVTDSRMSVTTMLEVFQRVASYLLENGVDEVTYKAIPHIYHQLPAEEDLYALFCTNARICRRDVAMVLEPARPAPVQERRKRGAKKASRAGVEVRTGNDHAPAYWAILEETLNQRYGVRPVHSLEEFQLLASRFPEDISLHGAFLGNDMLAGVVIYRSAQVAHVQYIAANEAGRELGALDLVFQSLISETYAACRYFDFGISTEQAGRFLNVGLVAQKEGFGARAVVYDHYVWSLRAEASAGASRND
jgi:hypothetical protein